jgi:hypothetical protein
VHATTALISVCVSINLFPILPVLNLASKLLLPTILRILLHVTVVTINFLI